MNALNDLCFEFSVNTNLIDKIPPKNTNHYKVGFQSYYGSIYDLETLIKVGAAFSYEYRDETRNKANFITTGFLAVDIDAGRTIEECLDDPIVKQYGSLSYTTVSHSPDHHKLRLVFILPRAITNAKELVHATRSLSRRLGGDRAATDAARYFAGSRGCISEVLGNQLSDEYLNELIEDGAVVATPDKHVKGAEMAAVRSNFRVQSDLKVISAHGTTLELGKIEQKTPIFCPFHPDEKASAFVGLNRRGAHYIHCMACQQTWREESDLYDDKDTFEAVVKALKSEGIKQHPSDATAITEALGIDKIPLKNITVVNQQYLQNSKIPDGLTLIKSPKGTGKTTFLARALKGLMNNHASLEDFEEDASDNPSVKIYKDENVLLIGHRQALIGDLCSRLSLNNYLDDGDYSGNAVFWRKKHYGVCLDSLAKVADNHFDVIVIDEVEQVLGHFLSDTIGFKREKLFNTLSVLLKKAKKIIVLDADLGWVTFDTLYSILSEEWQTQTTISKADGGIGKTLPIHILINEWKPSERSINIYSREGQILTSIKESILEKKRVFVASNSKLKIDTIEKMVAKFSKEYGLEIKTISITSKNSKTEAVQTFIRNIKQEILKYDVILSSPSLGTGVDITFENNEQEIDYVYGLFENRINSHFEMDQQLARVRHPKEVNVWISPVKFNFETEFDVILEETRRSNLINTVTQGIDVGSLDDQSPISPFLRMVATIVSTSRGSKNNLKDNFVAYKKSQSTQINWIELDRDASEEGTRIFRSMKDELAQDEINNILTAQTLNQFEYERLRFMLKQNDQEIMQDDLLRLYRTSIELFYGEDVTQSLLQKDKKGKQRKHIRLIEELAGNPTFTSEDISVITNDASRKSAKIKMETLEDRRYAAILLNGLLSLTPIYENGKFDTSVIFTKNDLAEFAAGSVKVKRFVEAQLGISTRKDVLEKPVQHLWTLLKLVGLPKDKDIKATKIKGEKVYRYKICEDTYNHMTEIIERRKPVDPFNIEANEKVGWKYVNNLYGFEYTDGELDYISGY